jgi:hypothetical protein
MYSVKLLVYIFQLFQIVQIVSVSAKALNCCKKWADNDIHKHRFPALKLNKNECINNWMLE